MAKVCTELSSLLEVLFWKLSVRSPRLEMRAVKNVWVMARAAVHSPGKHCEGCAF